MKLWTDSGECIVILADVVGKYHVTPATRTRQYTCAQQSIPMKLKGQTFFACRVLDLGLIPDRFTFTYHRSTQPCVSPGSLNQVPALYVVKLGMSPLLGVR